MPELALHIRVTGIYLLQLIIAGLCPLLILKNKKIEELKHFVTCWPVIFLFLYFVNGLFCTVNCADMERFKEVLQQRISFALCPLIITVFLTPDVKTTLRGIFGYTIVSTVISWFTFMDGVAKGFNDAAGNWKTLHRNLLSDTCADACIAGLVFVLSFKDKLKKLLFAVPMVLGLLGLFATQSRGGILALMLSGFLTLLYKRVSAKKMVMVMSVIVLAIIGLIFVLPEERLAERTSADSGTSAAARPYFWKLCQEYLLTTNCKPIGWGQRLTVHGNLVGNYCNIFLEDLIEGGLTGLFFISASFGTTVWMS